jgi:hypothetical protein
MMNLALPVLSRIFPLVRIVLALALLTSLSGYTAGQQDLPELWKKPLEKINPQGVKATVSFLASDEMAGRDTPSRELQIASAYVATRLAAAGLVGGGDKQTFYQTTRVPTVQLPDSGVEFRVWGAADREPVSLQNFGLLSGDAAPFEYRGPLAVVSIDQIDDQQFKGPVYLQMEPYVDQPGSFADLARATARLKRNGATAILIPSSDNSPLVERARLYRQPKLVQTRGGIAGPTLLVAPLAEPVQDRVYSLVIPKLVGGTGEVRNVIGILPGSDPELAREAIIFSAHLDHIGQSESGIYNGADDNATGVTAVISLAEAFAALEPRPKRTLIFMTFWGEERGLLGSRFYVSQPTWPLERIVANVNIEMIGRPEAGAREKIWMTGWQHSDLGQLIHQSSQRIGITTFEHLQFSQMLYRASDNYSFVEKGVIAHSFSAGSLHQDYHQTTDQWERLDLPHMTRVIQGLFIGTLPLANGEVTPQKKE